MHPTIYQHTLTRHPVSIAEWYDALSNCYDELYGREQAGKHEKVFGLVGPRQFDLVVDIGCGTGLLLQRMKGTYSRAIGIDLSNGMLSRARKKAGSSDIDFIRADCSALPIRNDIASCAFCISTMEANTEPEKDLSELARMVKRGGILLFTLFHDEGAVPDIGSNGVSGIEEPLRITSRETLYLARQQV